MAFERVELTFRAPKAPAGVTITQNGKAVIALRKDVVAKAGFKKDMAFAVLLGIDDDHGKLRIVKDKAGVACARELERTGAFFFNLGVMPVLGVTPSRQRPAEARCVDGGVEIDLPPHIGPKLLAPPAKAAAEQPPAAKAKAAESKSAGESLNGITIDLTEDSESVSFKGKTMDITTRQARLVHLLARPRPSPVAESFLVKNLWERAPANAPEQLRQMAADLQKGLSGIGLDLRLVKGAGYQIRDL